MGWRIGFGRRIVTGQLDLPFLARSRRRQRRFKQSIAVSTLMALLLLSAAVPKGRSLAAVAIQRSGGLVRQALGLSRSRDEIDAEWDLSRQQALAETSREFERVFDSIDPATQRLMAYAGNDVRSGLLRWGNFRQTLLLPSTVFEADDTGRSYRLRPNTRSVWLGNLTIRGIPLTFFLVPDGPGLDAAAAGTTAVRVVSSEQTTNSWGVRGPEPNLRAPLRGIVLGDSFMQGMLIGDDDTPPERLRRHLQDAMKIRVSILNTGHLGYSTEQEFRTLQAFGDRFRPHFVVLHLFANDFGDLRQVVDGQGNWEEGRYWLDRIASYCQYRRILLVTTTAPLEEQVVGRRFAGNYPGRIVNLLEAAGTLHVDVSEEFVSAQLRLSLDAGRSGRRPQHSPLFNGAISDGHFSADGSDAWARAVSRRLVLLLQPANADPSRSPGASVP